MTQVVIDLTSYAGQSVIVRFRLATDTGTAGSGWYVDDVRVASAGAGVIGKVGLAVLARVNVPRTVLPASALATPPNGVTWRSYYYAGSTRIAMRVEGDPDPTKNGVYYLHADRFAWAARP